MFHGYSEKAYLGPPPGAKKPEKLPPEPPRVPLFCSRIDVLCKCPRLCGEVRPCSIHEKECIL